MEHRALKEILPVNDNIQTTTPHPQSIFYLYLQYFCPGGNFNVVFRQHVIYPFVLP